MGVVRFALQLALGLGITAWVLRRDIARLSYREQTRAWNDASFWSAVVAFGPMCVPVHFARTRRSAAGFGVGLLWTLAIVVVLSVVDECLLALG